jgi:hypothetical protein
MKTIKVSMTVKTTYDKPMYYDEKNKIPAGSIGTVSATYVPCVVGSSNYFHHVDFNINGKICRGVYKTHELKIIK